MSSKLFSQIQFVDGEDTLTCLTNSQSKFLIESYYRSVELDTILKLSYVEIFDLNKIISKQKDIITNDSLVIKNKESMINLYSIEKNNLSLLLKEEEKKVKRQRNQKRFVIIFGVMLTTYLMIK